MYMVLESIIVIFYLRSLSDCDVFLVLKSYFGSCFFVMENSGELLK